jgi:H+-transporting ATPase
MTPIGWRNAGLVWAYCIIWFLIEDFAKIFVYKTIEEKNFILSH